LQVSDYLVTGIAPSSDTAPIEEMLAKNSLQNERLAIITKAKAKAQEHQDHHGGPSLSQSSQIMTGSGGTGVPGVGGGTTSLSSFAGAGNVPDYLGGLPLIPPDQAHNFNIAISEGRGLVTYKATPQEAASVETVFRQAGLRNVKIFKPKETIPSG
jgi:hypothetical protein